jgi:restriction endonuclease S subunit
MMAEVHTFCLADYLPLPMVKGKQPSYLETLDAEGIPVVSTLAVQNLSIEWTQCRVISEDDFDSIDEGRRLGVGDVVLTMDGGTSIGKPAVFEAEDTDATVDSHLAILRPEGLDPWVLAYLLASPLGQLQFQRAESGASGQTSVNEEDIRRFVFPLSTVEELSTKVQGLHKRRLLIEKEMVDLKKQEREAWKSFSDSILEAAAEKP